MDANDFLLGLTREALSGLEGARPSLVTAMRRAIRIARMRSDWEAVYWLSVELEPIGDKEARQRRVAEVAPHFTKEEMNALHHRAVEQTIASRTLGIIDESGRPQNDKITSLSAPELEALLTIHASIRPEALPANLLPRDAAALSEARRTASERRTFDFTEMTKVLVRLTQRTHAYLSRVEQQLFRGYLQADFVEHNRRFVEGRLAVICPEALEQLRSAHVRAAEDTPEARSHSLTSCRRALKSLADRLYPARKEPVRGTDGKERILDDSKFVNRLWQFIADSAANSTSGQLLQGEVEQLGATVERLNELASKGVHAEVTAFDVNACLASLYSLSGAVIRLFDQVSGASLDPETLQVPEVPEHSVAHDGTRAQPGKPGRTRPTL